MASLIPGYEYDIFISYRQKDNKHDGWVTEFVDNLKGELESTFKEDISIYFDENPHDRLMETHDVDKSLEGKLKCLIFIPILSQTYCDPNSYAWQYEFLAFNRFSIDDHLGKNIRLRNGNYASRILPIRIHELEYEDVKLFEKETGSVLRAMDFVFKTSSGVNRPLKVNEDHPNDNLNKTFYGDQINKVANAIKEIILGLKTVSGSDIKSKDEQSYEEVQNEVRREKNVAEMINKKTKKWLMVTISVIIFIAGTFSVIKIIEGSKRTNDIARLEKSIAVLPFVNDSPDKENEYFCNGMMDEILNNLQKIKDFRVLSRTSVEQYRGESKPTIPKIAKALDVNYIVEGSVQKYGNTFRLSVQLISANNEKHLWGESFEQEIKETKDIFKIQSQIAQSIASELEATITLKEIQLIEKNPTANLEAYDAYLKGLFFYEKQETNDTEIAIKRFKEAINHDSTFSLPWTYLSMCYWRRATTTDQTEFRESKRAAEKALELDPNSAIAIVNIAEILDNEYDFEGAENRIKLALKIDPDNPYVLRNAGRFYTLLGRGDKSISFCNKALESDPNNSTALFYLAHAYYYSGHSTEAWITVKRYQELGYPDIQTLYYQLLLEERNFDTIANEVSFEGRENEHYLALVAATFAIGDKKEAEKLCGKLIADKVPAYWIAFAYAYGDYPLKVFDWLEKSYEQKEKHLTFLGVDPAFKKYRNEPRIVNLLKKMKYPV